MKKAFLSLPFVTLLLFVSTPFAAAAGNHEYTQIGHDIRVSQGQQTGDLTCIQCSIYVRGEVGGEATAIHGNVVIENEGMVGGDVTAILGDVRVGNGTKIGGDATAVGGAVRRQTGAIIGGDVTSLEGQSWFWLILGFPIVLFAGIVALIVWLVQRRRTPVAPLARAA